MSRDQKFFDMYTLVIGVLAAFALAILVLAMKMSALTQDVYVRDTDEYQKQVESRIRPLSQVYMPGEEQQAPEPKVQPAAEAKPVSTKMSGAQVYNAACIACHGAGIGGAPVFGNHDDWAPRIAKGMDTLHDHALHGFTGDHGTMPAKGGRVDLSDEEIKAAVDYMASKAK